MEKNVNLPKISTNINNKIFFYIFWVVTVMCAIYTLYFFYSLATNGSIIHDTIHPAIFFVTGTFIFFVLVLVNQVMWEIKCE